MIIGFISFSSINVFSDQDYPNPIGLQNILVIPIQFIDEKSVTSHDSFTNIVNEMNEYFKEVSYNKISLEIDILDNWIDLPHDLSYYGKDRHQPGDDEGGNSQGRLQLVFDAVKSADKNIDFSEYDYLILVHSAKDQEKTNPNKKDNNIWSYSYWGLSIPTQDGEVITRASIVSEESPLGVWIHEYLHQLGELPDLWSSEFNDHFVGIWSPLDMGVTLGVPLGSSPPHLTSWSKIKLGWINPLSLSLNKSKFIIGPIESSQSEFHQAAMLTLPDGTYYLIEVREKVGFDESLPSEGVLIYLVGKNGIPKVLIPRENEDNIFKSNSILKVGDSISNTLYNLEIEVISESFHGYEIQISINQDQNIVMEIPNTAYILQPFSVNVKTLASTIDPKLNLYVDDVLYESVIGYGGNYQVDILFSFDKVGDHVIKAIVADPATGNRYEIAKYVYIDLPNNLLTIIIIPIIVIILILTFFIIRTRNTTVVDN